MRASGPVTARHRPCSRWQNTTPTSHRCSSVADRRSVHDACTEWSVCSHRRSCGLLGRVAVRGALLRRALGGARGHGRGVRARCASHCGQHRTAARPGSARARSVAAGGRADSVCAVECTLGHHPCGRRSHGPCRHRSAAGSGDRLEQWHLRARSEEANAVLHVQGRGQAIPPSTGVVGRGEWSVGAPVASGLLQGWTEAGERGGKIFGAGIVLHRGGDGRPGAVRRGLYVLSEDLSLGVDEQGPARLVGARSTGVRSICRRSKSPMTRGWSGSTCAQQKIWPLHSSSPQRVARRTERPDGRRRRSGRWRRWGPGTTARAGAQVTVVEGSVSLQSRRGLVVWTDDRPLAVPDRPQAAPKRSGRRP